MNSRVFRICAKEQTLKFANIFSKNQGNGGVLVTAQVCGLVRHVCCVTDDRSGRAISLNN